MDVSVIIINYNTLNLTKNTIKSVLEKTKDVSIEIILVDNNSADGSREYFDNIEEIKFIKNVENIGFGNANNIGLKESKGKYVFFLNSDTILINNAIKILFEFMENNLEAGVCGGNLYYEDLSPGHSFEENIFGLKDEFKNFYKFLYKKIYKKRLDFNYSLKYKEVGYVTGADMFVRKEVLDKLGGFDSDFFMYYEETELTNRIKKLGYRIYSVPQAKIIHLEGKSSEYKELKFKMMTESKYKYFYKVHGKKMMKYSYFLSQFKYLLLPIKINRIKLKLNRKIYKKIDLEYR